MEYTAGNYILWSSMITSSLQGGSSGDKVSTHSLSSSQTRREQAPPEAILVGLVKLNLPGCLLPLARNRVVVHGWVYSCISSSASGSAPPCQTIAA